MENNVKSLDKLVSVLMLLTIFEMAAGHIIFHGNMPLWYSYGWVIGMNTLFVVAYSIFLWRKQNKQQDE